MTRPRKVPNIPAHLYEPNLFKSLSFIGYALILYFGFGAVTYMLATSGAPLYLTIPLMVISTVLSGQGLHLLGIAGHEGFHFSLHKNRDVSAGLGLFFSSAAIGHFDVGFAVSHWNHHFYANTDKDPDALLLVKFKNVFTRALLVRPTAGPTYALNTLRLALNQPLGYKAPFPMSKEKLRLYARLNFLAVGAWIGIYGALFLWNPLFATIAIVAGHFGAFCLSGLRPYMEHAGMGQKKLERTRSYGHTVWTILFCGVNFHSEHHLFPNVPCYNLPKVNALMNEANLYRDLNHSVNETSFWAPLKSAMVDGYPKSFAADSDSASNNKLGHEDGLVMREGPSVTIQSEEDAAPMGQTARA